MSEKSKPSSDKSVLQFRLPAREPAQQFIDIYNYLTSINLATAYKVSYNLNHRDLIIKIYEKSRYDPNDLASLQK